MIVSKTLSVGGPLDHGVTTPIIDNNGGGPDDDHSVEMMPGTAASDETPVVDA
jgi:hypothetical protein